MESGFTERVALFSTKMRKKNLNEDLEEQFKKLLLDYLCAVITGSQTEVSRRVIDYLQTVDRNPMSTVFGHIGRMSHLHAAFANGTSAHCLDFDDGHTMGSVHPGAVIFSSVLATAEKEGANTESIIKAIIVGYEVTIRIASVLHPSSRVIGYHNTPVAGVFGAAAAISSLLQFNLEHTIGALGNASSFAGGTFAFLGSGSEIKRLHPGIAARDGIISAELAKSSLLGPNRIFEKDGGVFDIFAHGKINEHLMSKPLDQDYEIFNVYFKPYPCCRHLHVAIDAIKDLKSRYHFLLEQIESIQIGVNRVTLPHSHKTCKSLLDAQMSLPYAAAVTLMDDEVTIRSFNIARPDHLKIEQLMKKINVYFDEDCENVYPQKRKVNLAISLNTGQVIKSSYDLTKGEHPNPMTLYDLENKFTVNCIDILGSDKVRQIIMKVRELDIYGILFLLKKENEDEN